MNIEKQLIIEALLAKVKESPYIIIVDYTEMTVPEFNEVRNRLRECGAILHISKNSYIKQATTGAELPEDLHEHCTGQSAIVVGEDDICAAAKVLKNFAAEFSRPEIKAGSMDGDFLPKESVLALASLPSKEILLGQLLGVLQAPASKLVRTLNEPGASLARLLQAKQDQG